MTRRRGLAARLWVACAVISVATACGVSPPSTSPVSDPAPAESSTAPLAPRTGVYLGMFYGDADETATVATLRRRPQVHLTYFGWADDWTSDPVIAHDAAENVTTLVNWEPFDVDFADIVAGRYDTMLAQRARQAATLPHKVFLDFAAEMNEEEGWGGHDPALYTRAYRHIHDIFSGRDGGNVVWVWAPNNVDSAGAPDALGYYPGASYVDWTGIDGYNWGTSDGDHTWQTFSEVFRDKYDDLRSLHKPIIIGETASAEEGGDKAAWIRDLPQTLSTQFPDVRALVWFDVRKERDWRIHSSDAALKAFVDMASNPLFTSAR